MDNQQIWTVSSEPVGYNSSKYQLWQSKQILSYKSVIRLWKSNSAFRSFFNTILKNCSYKAFYWEVAPVTSDKLGLPFEFVLVNGRSLFNLTADVEPFKEYFEPNISVVTFSNLGGDAHLLVPSPIGEEQNYAHLALFVRNAPTDQIDDLWKKLGEEYEKLIGSQPRWLSTAGLGVSWLHLRIDSRPKYYKYKPYRLF